MSIVRAVYKYRVDRRSVNHDYDWNPHWQDDISSHPSALNGHETIIQWEIATLVLAIIVARHSSNQSIIPEAQLHPYQIQVVHSYCISLLMPIPY
jgi:hypothetical protein